MQNVMEDLKRAEFELLRVQRLVDTEFQLSTSDAAWRYTYLGRVLPGGSGKNGFVFSRTVATMRERLVVVGHVGLTKGEPY